MRIVFLASFLAFSQLVFAQDGSEFRVSWDCVVPEEKVVCLRPSGLVQWGLSYSIQSRSGDMGLALGARLQAQTRWEGVRYQADLGLWYETSVQFGVLEAFAEMHWGEFGLSLGKRRDYSGPWDDTLLGRDGRWGVFTRYNPTEAPWLGLELAYLPNAGWAGGQGFVGGRADIFQVGTFVEVVQVPNGLGEQEPSIRLIPRLGLQGREVELFWQWDRGLWSTLSLPLLLGQALALVLQCPCDADTQAWVEALDKSRVEGLLWWNPEWDYLGENSPFLPEDRFQAWLQEPRKLLIGAAYSWNNQLRLGVDLSRAPVEALRLYLRLYWQGR
ncbi:hypothetical protein [Meiothermus sp.]|uniref:hypothetical protein n=1 Tax=Meiothermus sp. TaxID=1955249 RepID=UPI00307EA6EF